MTSPLSLWAAGGFGPELIPVCGPNDCCSSPGKRPHLPGWQEVTVTPALLSTWGRVHAGNVGLRTRNYPAVDLDIEIPSIADACEEVIATTIGLTARRTRANSARRLLLFRLEGAPFEKSTIRFVSRENEPAQIEILAAGQQVVVAGVHHSGATIEWHHAMPVAEELATITAAQRDLLVRALRARLTDLGCSLERPPTTPPRSWLGRGNITALDREIAELALRRLDPDCPYDDWLRIGMALHARWPDETGLAFWDAWSSRGQKYPGSRELERHWASFRPDRGVGFGTLIVMARRATR
jgi:hypothetical protein